MPDFDDTIRMVDSGVDFLNDVASGETISDPPSSYPMGLSVAGVSNADGWPNHGNVITINNMPDSFIQIFIIKDGALTFLRSADSQGNFTEWRKLSSNGGWQTATYENGWVRYNSTYPDAAYFKDYEGVVRIRGMVKSGAIRSSVFTLPVGYRPAERLICPTVSNSAMGSVRIYTDGKVIPWDPSNNNWVSLSGISFQAEQ